LVTDEALYSTVISLYFCPSRRAPTSTVIEHAGVNPDQLTSMLSDYVGAAPAGYGVDTAGRIPNPVPLPQGRSNAAFFASPGNQFFAGVFARSAWVTAGGASPNTGGEFVSGTSSPTKSSQITDGTSNTMMIGEKFVRADWYEGGSWGDDRGWTDGWAPDTMRLTGVTPRSDSDGFTYTAAFPDRSANAQALLAGTFIVYNFGSAHSGGFNGAFADGSVHFLSFDIDPILFNNLGDRQDGNVASLP